MKGMLHAFEFARASFMPGRNCNDREKIRRALRFSMIVEEQITINGSRAAVWDAISDIGNAANLISGIEQIEIFERPELGIVGLRWRETRILFDKPATVEKWITDAVENEFYSTRAEDGGFVFNTTKRITESGGAVVLSEVHEFLPQGISAKLMSIPMRLFFKGTIKKALLKDLQDIKTLVERKSSQND